MVTDKLHQILAELPRYEPRPQQERMAQLVERAIAEGMNAVIEAGTGSGKTMAYLVPLLGQDTRAVISTGTIALQSQLMDKDLKFLERTYGRPFKYVLAKGRQNYLCPLHLEEADRLLPPVGEDREQLDQVMEIWRDGAWDGDVATLPFRVNNTLWRQELTCASEECHGPRCDHYHRCPYVEARRGLEEADIIVANHAMYMTDVASGGAVLPKHKIVVFDEAHKVEDAATNAFTVSVGRFAARNLLRKIVKRLKGIPWAEEQALGDADERFLQWAEKFGFRTRRLYRDPRLLEIAQAFVTALSDILDFIKDAPVDEYILLDDSAESAKQKALLQRDALVAQTQGLMLRWMHFEEVMSEEPGPNANHVHWLQCTGMGQRTALGKADAAIMFSINSAPLDVASHLRDHLWPFKISILTSATLGTDDSLDFIKRRWGLDASMDVILPPAFDYSQQAVLYAPSGLPSPNAPTYNEAIARAAVPLIERTSGRALYLFTSYKAMREVAEVLREHHMPFPIKTQDDWPRPKLLNWFRAESNPILLATASFWEGVDIPGDTLSCVIIDRLPFAHPEDPVVQANTERLKATGQDWFNDYSLPAAILVLKQGFGRLIRSHEDTGVVCIMDPRLMTMRYGEIIRRSLPNAPVVRSLDDERFRRLFPDA
ncbi:MAG TPA: ATP-dependent DNA helicase [Armatimonadota bacterium]|jgi:ATP-dependent DNA helicase DinG